MEQARLRKGRRAGSGGVNTFLFNHGQVKHLTTIFIPSPKKRDVTECTNCTIALFPHAYNIILRIIQKQLDQYKGHETPMERAGLRKGRGTREQIANVSDSWRVRGSTTKNVSLFYRLYKGFW
jgi:hypothetical protein